MKKFQFIMLFVVCLHGGLCAMEKPEFYSVVGEAIRAGDIAKVKSLFDDFDDVDFQHWKIYRAGNLLGFKPLHIVSLVGHCEFVKLILDEGIDPDTRADFNTTPLYWAAREGQDAVVELLLNRGADPNIGSISGSAPLHKASKRGFLGIVRLLLDHKADVHARGGWGRTPLHKAAYNVDNKGVIELLLAHGADSTLRDKTGYRLCDSLRPEIQQLMREHQQRNGAPTSTMDDSLRQADEDLQDWVLV